MTAASCPSSAFTPPPVETPSVKAAPTGPLHQQLPPAPPVLIPRNGVDYRNKIVLAPMVRSGELPSRLLALHYGADLVWGPETVDRSMIGTTMRTNPRTGCLEWTRLSSNNVTHTSPSQPPKESVIYRIDPKRESRKLIYQIGTASPTYAVQAATLVAPYVAGIDVNAGCPKPFSTTGGMGAQLLRTPDLLASILSTLVTEVGTPHEIGISVKIRLLETPELTSSLVHKLCQTGITGLTIHCRTTPMRPRERALREQLRMIGNICHSHGVACIMNGDVTSREEGLALAKEYGVDGAMIATAAEANSSVFRTKDQGGSRPWREVVIRYLKYAMSVENKWGNTKFLLSQLMPGKNPAYQPVTMSKTYSECLNILAIEDEEMLASARAVDEILGLKETKVSRSDLKRERKAERSRQDQEQGLKKPKRDVSAHTHGAIKSQTEQELEEVGNEKRHAENVTENAGLEGVGIGALAVAV